MARAAAVVLVVAGALVACGGGDDDQGGAATADPVLTVASVCYGGCPYAGPPDVPDVAVYEDGTVVATAVEDGRAVQRRSTLDTAELDGVLGLAERAGLLDGGVAANGSTRGTADGSGTLFTGRDGDVRTVVEAPFLGFVDEFAEPVDLDQRRDLEALLDRLVDAGRRGEAETVERYADRGERCEIVEKPTTRPLLPHEQDCDDVAATLADLHLDELDALRR